MSEEIQVRKNAINIGDAIKQGFEILKQNFVLLLVTAAITVLVSGFTGTLLLGPMMMGMFYICDKLILGGSPKPEIGDLFAGFSFIVPGIVLDIIGDVGALVCGVGILITLPVASWAMMRIVDTKMSLGDALKDAIRFVFTEKNYSFILLHFVAGLLASIGALLCGIGVFATLPLFFVIPACAYRQVYPLGK